MQEKQLHKLGKTDLLTLIYKQEKEIQRLTKEVEELKQQLDDRTIQIKEAGSIAEASLKINKIFEVAQQAADEYLRSIKEVNKPSHECAEINGETSKDKANIEIQNDFRSEDTYEEYTKEKIPQELILINNNIMFPKTKLLKRVLTFFIFIGTILSKFAILIANNTVIFSKKIRLNSKINFIKLKCKIVIIKNYLQLILKKLKNHIISFIKACKALLILLAKKTKRKMRRVLKRFNCNIEKSKRFFIKKIKSGFRLTKKVVKNIGRAIKYTIVKICKLLQKMCIKTRNNIQKTIKKCKVRLIVFKFKVRNIKSYKTKLLEKANEVKTEKVDNALIVVNNNLILYRIKILTNIKKYLKQLKAILVKISKKVVYVVDKTSKKIQKVLKKIIEAICKIIKKIFGKIVLCAKKVSASLTKRITILKMKFINKAKHTKLINEINDHIHIEETKNALILIETDIKPFKQKTLIKLLISLKKTKIKVTALVLKATKRALIISNRTKRKLVIVIKKLKRGTIKNCKKAVAFIKKTIIKIKEKIREKKIIRQMSKDTHKAIIKNLQISMPDLEKELKRRKQKSLKISFIKTLGFSTMVIIAFAIITSTSLFKILQVSGTSMEPNLHEGELLITSKFFKYEKGDMVAFYYNDSVLIKRVIATEGDTVYIEYDGTVYVNNEKLQEDYVKELSYGNCDLTFPYQVPKDSVFILGDNRATSVDSRSDSIGCISTDKIIGKIQIRLNPFVIY